MTPTYAYAIDTPNGILLGLSSDPERSCRWAAVLYPGPVRLIGFLPSTVDKFNELQALCEPHRNPDGLLAREGAVLGFLAALPVYEMRLQVVGEAS